MRNRGFALFLGLGFESIFGIVILWAVEVVRALTVVVMQLIAAVKGVSIDQLWRELKCEESE